MCVCMTVSMWIKGESYCVSTGPNKLQTLTSGSSTALSSGSKVLSLAWVLGNLAPGSVDRMVPIGTSLLLPGTSQTKSKPGWEKLPTGLAGCSEGY